MNLSRLALMMAGVSLVLAGCGGGSGGDAAPGTAPPVGTPPPPSGGTPPSSPDTTAPTVTLTSPVNLATPSASLNLAATAADNVGVAGVTFQVDGVQVGAEDTTAPYALDLAASGFANGQHVVRARSRDAAGNLSTWSSATVRLSGGGTVASGFTKNESWVTTLNGSTALAAAPDGRIFVAQQSGAVRIVKAGALLPQAFVQLSNVDSNGERGLIGIALDPDFANNGYVYLHYTSTLGGSHNRVSRVVANGDFAPGAETVLFDLPNLSGATNHNGGAIHFGADGKLYVGVGDNANSSNSPLPSSVFGKMLRFNADGTIPTDNPYLMETGLARAIWARGLRNPFTFAVQPGTGKIHINDVGDATWEEVNVGASGANYGWPSTEGPTAAAGVTAPLFAYRHSATTPPGSGAGGFLTGFSIAGGAFYPTTGAFPAAYRSNYFFADYVSRFVARQDPANGDAVTTFATLTDSPVDMIVADGVLYVLTRSGITRITAN
ncbi:MAG: hypothetical protein RLZZ618_3981 [Pseudomonadota bacterium]